MTGMMVGEVFIHTYLATRRGDVVNRRHDDAICTPYPPCSKRDVCRQLSTIEPVVLERLAAEIELRCDDLDKADRAGCDYFANMRAVHVALRETPKHELKKLPDAGDASQVQPAAEYEEVHVPSEYKVAAVKILHKDVKGSRPGIY